MPVLSAYITPHPPLAVEHVGKGAEARVPGTISSFHTFGRHVADAAPETIVVISPHAPSYLDYFHISPGAGAVGDFSSFGVKREMCTVTVNYDQELTATLERASAEAGLKAGTLGGSADNAALDHGVMVPLWFVNKFYHPDKYKIVRVSLSGLSAEEHYRLGMIIRDAIDRLGRKAVIVASGDLSHSLNKPGTKGARCRAFDEKLTGIMKSGRLEEFLLIGRDERDNADECGLGSFMILAGILHKVQIKTEFLSYEGTYGVGYAHCIMHINSLHGGPDYLAAYKERQGTLMEGIRRGEGYLARLARETVEAYVTTGALPPEPELLPDSVAQRRAGVFVSIKKNGELRGCIGTMSPTTGSVMREIRQNAVSACSRDFRFDPVEPDELPELTYSVDVLSEPEPVPRGMADSMLDPKIYGVIVTDRQKRGVLLPDLEGVDTISEQLDIALRKAGIKGEAYSIERFTVERHK